MDGAREPAPLAGSAVVLKKLSQPFNQPVGFPHLALPNYESGPSQPLDFLLDSTVAPTIALELGKPKILSGLRRGTLRASLVAVPEATMYPQDLAPTRKGDVRPSGHCPGTSHPYTGRQHRQLFVVHPVQ